MQLSFRAFIPLFLFAIFATVVPNRALAQNPPAGAIFDLSTVQTTAMNASAYTQFSTSFVADNTAEYVSFAFREVPAYFSFDNASVAAATSPSTNLLLDPGFELDAPANLGTNYPVDWGRWIQPIDTSAIGEVSGTSYLYGCSPSGPASGTYFWCDGSVQGYDAIYQQLSGLTVGATYDISWLLTDDSGSLINNPNIDMLVYAGDQIPVGTGTIGTPPPPVIVPPTGTPGPTPEPSSFIMLGTGMLGLAGVVRGRFSRKQSFSA